MTDKRYPQTILATACLPWTQNDEFDRSRFKTEVESLVRQDIRHIYLFGTAGEGYAVTDRQFEQITACFVELMAGQNANPIIGLLSLSLPSMLDRLRRAYDLGIRSFLFALPAWGALQDDELFDFMHRLCDPWPDCTFIHYNNIRAKRLLEIKDYERLADEIPNLVATKYSTADPAVIESLAQSRCPLRFFLTECGFATGSRLADGDFGLLLSIASSNLARAKEFFTAGRMHDADRLQIMQEELDAMVRTLLDRVGNRIDGAYDKIFCKIRNPDFPLRLLPPYRGSSDEAYKSYLDWLKTDLPDWLGDSTAQR